jgi:hypothetical protein
MGEPHQVNAGQEPATTNRLSAILIAGAVAITGIAAAGGAYFLMSTAAQGPASSVADTVSQADPREAEIQAEELVRQARIAELIGQGNEALDAGKLVNPPQKNALVFYEQALAIDPSSAAARKGIENVLERGAASALAAIQTDQLADAEELMFIVRAIDPNNDKLAGLTQALADARSAAAQQAEAQEAQQLTEVIERAEQALIERRLDTPDGDNALHYFREALSLEASNKAAAAGITRVADALLARAHSLLEQNDIDGANAALDSISAIDPSREEVATIRASVVAQQAKAGDTFAEQRQVALLSEARIYRDAGQIVSPQNANALASYTTLLQLDPTNAEARNEVGAMAAKLTQTGSDALDAGDDSQARYYHKQAAQVLDVANTPAANNAQATLSARLAELDALARAAQVEALLTRAEAALAAGRLRAPKDDNALDQFNSVLAIAPGNQRAIDGVNSVASRYVNMAEDAMVAGNLPLAQEHLASAEQIAPELHALAGLRARIASTRAEQGKSQERRVALKAQVDASLAEARAALNDGRLSAPADNSALTHFRKVLELMPDSEAARSGIADIGRRHVANAYFAITNERFEAAEMQISAAAAIEPPPPDLESAVKSLVAARKRVEAEQVRQRLDAELAAAQAALSQGELVTSNGDSALSHYQAALALDAGNSVALNGIKLVFDALLRHSRVAIENTNFDDAESALSAAAKILPSSTIVKGLRERVATARVRAAQREQNRARVSQLLAQAEQSAAKTNDPEALVSAAELLAQARQLTPDNPQVIASQQGLGTQFAILIEKIADAGNTVATARLLTTAGKLFPKAEWLEETRAQVQSRLSKRDPDRAAQITALMQRAERQLALFYLTTPANNNANQTYQQVLELDPYNEGAKLGFERVVERYMLLAEQGLNQGNRAEVKKFLDLATLVIANYGDSRDRALALYNKIGTTPAQ